MRASIRRGHRCKRRPVIICPSSLRSALPAPTEWTVVVFSLLLGPALAGSEIPQDVWRMLDVGMYRRALARIPEGDSPRHHVARGRALAGLVRCAEALEAFDAVEQGARRRAPALVAEGLCRRIVGEYTRSELLLVEATDLAPSLPRPWTELALTRSELGETRGVVDALAALRELQHGERRAAYVWAEHQAGISLDAGWSALEAFRDENRAEPEPVATRNALLIEARLWLDLDDPMMAAEVLTRAVALHPGYPRTSILRAECVRRLGEASESLLMLRRKAVAAEARPLRAAFLARAHVDLGEFDDAEKLLDMHPNPLDVDYLASRWYLARARGDARADEWEQQWRERVADPRRNLTSLVPVQEREP